MLKKILICALIYSNILAMEKEKLSKTIPGQEAAFNALVAAHLNKFPQDKQKEIGKYLELGQMPTEIKEMIAKSLVDAVNISYSAPIEQAGLPPWQVTLKIAEYKSQIASLQDELRNDLNALASVNKQFYDIINDDSFIKYAVKTLQNKFGINNVSAALFLATPKVASWLKKQKLDPKNINENMDAAATHGDLVHLKFLFEIGANLRDSHALKNASELGWFLIVEFLLTKNPSQEQKNEALIRAVYSGIEGTKIGAGSQGYDPNEALENVVKLLIKAGADVNTQDPLGNSVLTIAKQKNLANIAKILENAGAIEKIGSAYR